MKPRAHKVTAAKSTTPVVNATSVAETHLDTSDRPNSEDNLKYRGTMLNQRPMTIKAHTSVRVVKRLDRDTRFNDLCVAAAKAKTVTIVGQFTEDASGKALAGMTPEVWVSRDEYETLRKSGSLTVTGVQLTAEEVEKLAAPILAAREERITLSEKAPDEGAITIGLTDAEGQAVCSVNAVDCRGKYKPMVQFSLTRDYASGKLVVKTDRNGQPVRIGSFRAVGGEIKGICPHCYHRLTVEAEKKRSADPTVRIDLRTFSADEVNSFIQRRKEKAERDSQAVNSGLNMFASDNWGDGFQKANHGGRHGGQRGYRGR